ncbi:hypothetical protein NOF04DRAFT_1340824 [Fusarium oxysporum II5]|nr:hypothetical protein NOF04DRAFT_1340824 [Fusarium oxysporum II5]
MCIRQKSKYKLKEIDKTTVIPELRTALILVQASLVLSNESSERCWNTHFRAVPHPEKWKGLTTVAQRYSITPLGLFGEEIVEVVVMPTHGMDEYSSAGWAADLGFGLEAISNILPKARSPKDIPTGEDHSPEGFSLTVLELVVKWEDGDIPPTDATFWGKIPQFDIISLDIRGELRPE